jgi:tRNA pseudouridine38-40 synthase
MRVALKFAYNSKNFNGYARQPNIKTVEQEIINFLIKNDYIKDAKTSTFRSASRTDKGVSALSNVIAFSGDYSKSNIYNTFSDGFLDIIIYGIAEVNENFNPRYAKLRQYRYYLIKNKLNVKKIIQTSNIFTGLHNFSNFTRAEEFRNPVRSIENIVISENKDFLIFDFFAQNFLWNQIRRIISALTKVGNNKIEKEEIAKALDNPNKKVDFGLAPAEPLILIDIFYNFDFKIDYNNFKKAKLLESQIISNL